jgi:hypothetical protein
MLINKINNWKQQEQLKKPFLVERIKTEYQYFSIKIIKKIIKKYQIYYCKK